jgi:alkylated DNA repair protein alkB family protein 6
MATAIDFASLMRKERAAAAAAAAAAAKPRVASGDCANVGDPGSSDAPAILSAADAPPRVLEFANDPSRFTVARTSSSLHGCLFYVPRVFSAAEEDRLIDAARREATATAPWTVLDGRRLRFFGGVPQLGAEMRSEPLPPFVAAVTARIAPCLAAVRRAGGSHGDPDLAPNHCLLNEYAPGEGIAWHRDGPLYDGVVAIVSLGAAATLRFRRQRDAGAYEHVSLFVERGSLVVFCGEAYTDWQHTVPAVEADTIDATFANLALVETIEANDDLVPSTTKTTVPRHGTRLSMTLRRVARTGDPIADLSTDAARDDHRRATSAFVRQLTTS